MKKTFKRVFLGGRNNLDWETSFFTVYEKFLEFSCLLGISILRNHDSYIKECQAKKKDSCLKEGEYNMKTSGYDN